LAVRYRDDYEAAHVPMLPVVASPVRIARNVFAYTVALVAATIAFAPVAHMGLTYVVVAAVGGAAYLAMAARLWVLAHRSSPIEGEAMRLFGYSITYLTVLFAAMAVDVFVRRIH
jgi:protoheme IX farnesyltransferase